MLVQPKKSQGRYSIRVKLENEELSFVEEFRYPGHIMTADCRDNKDIEINSGGKMQLATCWSGNSHLHLRRQKSNCSIRIVTKFTDVLFCVILTRTPLENYCCLNLLSIIVTQSNDLLMSPDTPARV